MIELSEEQKKAVAEAQTTFKNLKDNAEKLTQEQHFTEDDRHYMAEVQAHILVRTQHLRSQASDIPDIEV